MQGKIITSNVSLAKHAPADEFWLITRAGPEIPGMERHIALAPSPQLFHRYLTELKDTDPQNWWPIYRNIFLHELNSQEKLKELRIIYQKVKAGTTIGLVCYCPKPAYCHRSLIGQFLSSYGLEVEEVLLPPSPQLQLNFG